MSTNDERRMATSNSMARSTSFESAEVGPRVVVEGMAAQAYALTILANEQVQPLACPRCGEGHIDELQFATRPHIPSTSATHADGTSETVHRQYRTPFTLW